MAARWGLTESSYFGRVFKSAFGVSPREFRRWPLSGAAGE
ncbi:AraC family transcriptional regulator [Streptomyces sp. AC555_RSS877]|nr:AraC family transcriptional regulator [Streptomyces sp. AC555_RSS877]